jgi:hypothetical protein
MKALLMARTVLASEHVNNFVIRIVALLIWAIYLDSKVIQLLKVAISLYLQQKGQRILTMLALQGFVIGKMFGYQPCLDLR